MKELRELRERIENIESSYDYEEYYTELYNATVDYMNYTQDFDLEYLFEDIIDYDLAEDYAKQELENGGLLRLYYFLGDANLNSDIFKIDGYGNLTDINKDDLDYIKEELLNEIDRKIESDGE